MSVFFKANPCIPRVIPQWLQSDAKLNQRHLHRPKVTSKSLQNDPKVPQSDLKVMPKWRQSGLWHTKIPRRNVFNLLMSRLGCDLGPIRSEFAFDPTWQSQNGPKMDGKWTQNASKMHPQRTRIEPIGSEICFRSELTCSGWNDLGGADIWLGRQMGCQ